jgi:hypothetical protein
MFTAPQTAQMSSTAKRNSSSASQTSAAISVSGRSPRGSQWASRPSPKAVSGISNGSFNSATTPSMTSRSQLDAAGQSSTRRRSSQENKHTSSDDEEEDIIDVEVMDASIPPLGMENRQIAWQCGSCHYCVLAMDNKGKTLPISMNAWGKPIPLQCPRCLVSHTNWAVTSPFDAYGDHVNVKGTFANSAQFRQHNAHFGLPPRVPSPPPQAGSISAAQLAPGGGASDAQRLSTSTTSPPLGATLLDNLPPILASIGLVTYRGGVPRSTVALVPPQRKQRTAYFCGLCSRRLLRMDHNGDLVPLDTNAGGEILPLTCPGCGVSHGDWPIRPA